MTIALHNLQPQRAINKKSKRVGRGNASGHGTYSTRGIKGQKARSGVSGLKRLGMKQMLLSVPKVRGFKSRYAKNQVVNLESLNSKFTAGQTVSPASLAKTGLISSAQKPVKILSRGQLTVKNLTFVKVEFSTAARQAIVAADGKIND
jgi:large subunit ribosomal protein L15